MALSSLQSAGDSQAASRPQASYTPRAVLVGLLGVVVLAVGTQFAELWIHGTQVSQATPPINSFFVWLVIVVLVNTIFRVISRRLTLSRGELLLIYSMLIVSGGVVGIGLVHFIPAMITAPFYYGTPDQPWTELLQSYVPQSEWFAPRGELVIKYAYEGMPPTWTVPWAHWAKPLCMWALLGMLLAWCTVCICVILRRQWVENERLIFPLNYVPLAITESWQAGGVRRAATGVRAASSREASRLEAARTPATAFFRNRLMWMGFLIPTVFHAFNSLHQYWPTVPGLKIRDVALDASLAARPWNAARPISLWFYPMGVGMAYLLSRDVSFSLWFFYFLGKAQAVIGSGLGLGGGGSASLAGFPFLDEQSSGALLALALGSLWVGRRHLRRLWESSLLGRREDRHDPLPPGVAIFGLLIGLALIVAWWQLFGMSPKGTLLYFGIWFLYAIGLSRLVCEGGTVWIGTPLDPRMVVRNTLGVPALAPRDWHMMGYLRFLTMDWRCLMMPNVMSSLKFLETEELQPRGLVGSMMWGVALSIVTSFITITAMSYLTPGGGIGLSTWRYIGVPQEPLRMTGQFLMNPTGPVTMRVIFMALGGAGMIGLQAMRGRFLWWPLHPLGYPMAATFAMRNMWFSTFVAWAIKSLVLRYGGIPVYEKSRPFFLGLILGDFFNIALWLVIEGFTGLQDHFLYP